VCGCVCVRVRECVFVCVSVCVCVVRDAFEVKEEVGIFPVRDKVRISFLLSSVVVDTVQYKFLSSQASVVMGSIRGVLGVLFVAVGDDCGLRWAVKRMSVGLILFLCQLGGRAEAREVVPFGGA